MLTAFMEASNFKGLALVVGEGSGDLTADFVQ